MHQGEKALNSRSSRSSSPTTESKFASLSQQLSTPNNGRKWFQFWSKNEIVMWYKVLIFISVKKIKHLYWCYQNPVGTIVGRKLTTPPNLLKSTPFARTTSSICLINNNNAQQPGTPGTLNTSGPSSPPSKNASLSVQHQLRRSVSSSSLTKIAALNRMQLLQQQQRNAVLTGSSGRNNSGSSSNLSGGLFNSSLEVAHEEGRIDIAQPFSSTSTSSMRA